MCETPQQFYEAAAAQLQQSAGDRALAHYTALRDEALAEVKEALFDGQSALQQAGHSTGGSVSAIRPMPADYQPEYAYVIGSHEWRWFYPHAAQQVQPPVAAPDFEASALRRNASAFHRITVTVAGLCQSNRRRFWRELADLVEAEWGVPPDYDRVAWAMEHATLTLVEAAYQRVVGVE